VDVVERVDDALEAGLFVVGVVAFAEVGAGVGDEVGDGKGVAATDFFEEEVDGFFSGVGVGGGEVNEV